MKEYTVTWLHFLETSKKVVYLPDRQWTTTDTIQFFTVSSGSAGL